MNNRIDFWIRIAFLLLVLGVAAGPAGGGFMLAGTALLVYLHGARRRAERLRREVTASMSPVRRDFSGPRLIVDRMFREVFSARWQGQTPLDLAFFYEKQLAGIRYSGKSHHLLVLPPGQQIRFENELQFKTIGNFSLGALFLIVSRDWGITEIRCPLQSDCHVTVYPQLYPSLSLGAQNSMLRSLASGIHRFRRPGDGVELHEIREYRSGDPFRKILWSATAKTGRLIIRENETDVVIPVMFIMNTSWFLRFGSPRMMFDQLTETAMEVADASIRAGDPFGYCLYGDAGQSAGNRYTLPDTRSGKLGTLLQSLLAIRVQQMPPEQLDVPKAEKLIAEYLHAFAAAPTPAPAELKRQLKQTGLVDPGLDLRDPRHYAEVLNRIAEDASLPVPALHSRLKAPGTVELDLELQEIRRLKTMLRKLLPQIKGRAVFIVAVRPYENAESLREAANMLRCIPAQHHTLIVLYPDYVTFANLAGMRPDTVAGQLDRVLTYPDFAAELIRLDYEKRQEDFRNAVLRAGGMFQSIDAGKNAMYIIAAIDRLRIIQGARRYA